MNIVENFYNWLVSNIVVVLVIFTFAMVCAFFVGIASIYHQSKESDKFSLFCAQNNGVAVLDLDGKMRCVPTFSAAGVRK